MGAKSIHREVIRSPRTEPWGNGRGRERIQQRSLRRSDGRGGWGTRRFSGIQKEKNAQGEEKAQYGQTLQQSQERARVKDGFGSSDGGGWRTFAQVGLGEENWAEGLLTCEWAEGHTVNSAMKESELGGGG